jgi:hypothetical protein
MCSSIVHTSAAPVTHIHSRRRQGIDDPRYERSMGYVWAAIMTVLSTISTVTGVHRNYIMSKQMTAMNAALAR